MYIYIYIYLYIYIYIYITYILFTPLDLCVSSLRRGHANISERPNGVSMIIISSSSSMIIRFIIIVVIIIIIIIIVIKGLVSFCVFGRYGKLYESIMFVRNQKTDQPLLHRPYLASPVISSVSLIPAASTFFVVVLCVFYHSMLCHTTLCYSRV